MITHLKADDSLLQKIDYQPGIFVYNTTSYIVIMSKYIARSNDCEFNQRAVGLSQ